MSKPFLGLEELYNSTAIINLCILQRVWQKKIKLQGLKVSGKVTREHDWVWMCHENGKNLYSGEEKEKVIDRGIMWVWPSVVNCVNFGLAIEMDFHFLFVRAIDALLRLLNAKSKWLVKTITNFCEWMECRTYYGFLLKASASNFMQCMLWNLSVLINTLWENPVGSK